MSHDNHPITLSSMRLTKQLAGQHGFTLLELLIASIIFAIMAIMAYGGLNNVISNSQASKQALQRLQQIQQSVSVLNRDFRQLSPRPIRDEYGNPQAYLTTENNIDNLVEFSRGGRVNPGILLRSTLLRVAYQFNDGSLVRLQWPQLDRTQEMEAKKTTLIDKLEDISIKFLNADGEWQEQWPPINSSSVTATGSTTTNHPLAIEIILQLKDWGEVRRLYQVDLQS